MPSLFAAHKIPQNNQKRKYKKSPQSMVNNQSALSIRPLQSALCWKVKVCDKAGFGSKIRRQHKDD
jgi:ribosomal protein S12